LLGAGALLGAGIYHAVGDSRVASARSSSSRVVERATEAPEAVDDSALRAEIDRLRALLAERGVPAEEPQAADTPEAVEALLHEAYADNSVDLLLEAIRRLLRMGERGYPILRKMIEDIVFRGKFRPGEQAFRVDHIYRLTKLGMEEEKHIVGFINYLLVDPQTLPVFKQVAMMGAAYYVGSKAPGTEVLQQTLMEQFLAQSGMPSMPGMPANIGRKMQVFAMAMSGDPKMIGPLQDELKRTKDKREQGDILGALAYLGDPSTVPLIRERLDPNQGDFGQEIDALGRLNTEDSHKTATDFLRSIPDSKRFYQHTRRYMRAGGGTEAVMLMKERIERDPQDPEVASSIGALRRFPTKESREALAAIRDNTKDTEVKKRATEAYDEVEMKLRGEIPPEFRIGGGG
jgi:hypothetical protein